MSLTQRIKNPYDVLGAWMRQTFPRTRPFLKEVREAQQARPLLCGLPAGTAPSHHALIGMAMDYRLRCTLALLDVRDTVAWQGAWRGLPSIFVMYTDGTTEHILPPFPTDMHTLMDEWMTKPEVRGVVGNESEADDAQAVAVSQAFARLNDWLQQVRPDLQVPDHDAERTLCRHCLWLAVCERIAREGRSPYLLELIETLFGPDGLWDAGAADRFPAYFVDDMAQMTRAWDTDILDVLRAPPLILNPTFAGSIDAGGADADLVSGHCLWDIKCTVKDSVPGWQLYQLLGYALLDYEDRYALQDAGFFLPRRALPLQWPLQELMDGMHGGRVNIQALRCTVRDMLHSDRHDRA